MASRAGFLCRGAGARRSVSVGAARRVKASTPSQRAEGKARLLSFIEPLERGLLAGDEEQKEVERLATSLERMNPTKDPLGSDLANGKWKLVYTTSGVILGKDRSPVLRPSGPIYQTIDAVSGKARNQETTPAFNGVDADLTPDPANPTANVKVQFKTFKIFGLIPIKAPDTARGELEFTYLDQEMRICRGDKGNLFVLLMEDPSARLG